MHRLVLATVLTASLAAPRAADACGASVCGSGGFNPGNGATVPANLPGVHWQPRGIYDGMGGDPSLVTIAPAATPSVTLAFTATALADGAYALMLAEPLVEGTTYIVADSNMCNGETASTITIVAGPAAPLPAELGVLATIDGGVTSLEVATFSGSCSADVSAAQDSVELALAPDAVPWRDALHFETSVDDKPWRPQDAANIPVPAGSSWRGRGVDLVYSVCASEDETVSRGVDVGGHRVTMRATVPGSSISLVSGATTVDLQCAVPGGANGCSTSTGTTGPWLLLAFMPLVRRRRRGTP